jgi:biopolymer transport protein ExbB
VMGTLAEALVATAIGLLVAIPAVAAFNFFQRRVKTLVASSDTLLHVVTASLAATPSGDSAAVKKD